jgi:predicted nuclease of predicted toxin-antitoxin system
MKFIVDAQLPKKLSHFLVTKGYDSIHTLELPMRNLTSDTEIIEICEQDNRVVITKDSDFYESKLLRNKPQKLVVVLTGNIHNDLLINLFDNYIEKINELLIDNDIIEVDKNTIIAK